MANASATKTALRLNVGDTEAAIRVDSILGVKLGCERCLVLKDLRKGSRLTPDLHLDSVDKVAS